MDPTTKWLVRISCFVFLGGVIATPIFLRQQKLDKFCLEFSKEYGYGIEQQKLIRKDCRKVPKAYDYGD